MKQVTLVMFELTRQEVIELDEDAQVMIFNEITGNYSIWLANKYCPARSKNDCSHLRFYLFTVGELPKA